jgi:hypothetical protein
MNPNLNPQQFYYHGTASELHEGDDLSPRGATEHAGDGEKRTHVYASKSLQQAHNFAQQKAGAGQPRWDESDNPIYYGHVYKVEPVGKIEGHPGDENTVRTRGRLRVTGEVER